MPYHGNKNKECLLWNQWSEYRNSHYVTFNTISLNEYDRSKNMVAKERCQFLLCAYGNT